MPLSTTQQILVLVGLAALLLLVWLYRRLARSIRRRRPARLNPKLEVYGDHSKLVRERRAEAAKILATSSTATIAGFKVVRQIDAVFVEGFRRPEEALEGLKAAAAMRGANALINVNSEHTAAGRCSARGDAIIVREIETDQPEAVNRHEGTQSDADSKERN